MMSSPSSPVSSPEEAAGGVSPCQYEHMRFLGALATAT